MMHFGQVIGRVRKGKGFTLKDLASMIYKEDGNTISPQYLNDIEHNRRHPPGEYILEQLSQILEIDLDSLYYWAGEIPTSLRGASTDPDEIRKAMIVFRRAFKGNK